MEGLKNVESYLSFVEESEQNLDDGFLGKKEVRSIYLVTYSQSDMEKFPVTWKMFLRAYNWLNYRLVKLVKLQKQKLRLLKVG